MPVISTNTTAQNAANVNVSKVSFNTTTQASNAVSKASAQNNIPVQSASTPSNSVQEANHNAVIPQKSTPSNIFTPNQQVVGQIAEKGNLTLNCDTNQSISLNANGHRVLMICGVDNVIQKNGQTTVYSYDNGQVHQFDKDLNVTSGPSDHTILQNDGRGAIYISDGNSYQSNGYPESYTRLVENKNGLELQKIPTRLTYTFTQEGKETCNFPGKPTIQKVLNYQVNNNNSITITFENGTTQVLSNNWVKPLSLSNTDTNTSHDDSSKDRKENKLASESISDINSAYNKLPNETYNQTITFHDDVTGESKTITTSMQVKKGDKYIVYNTDLRLPYGYYLDCNNLVKNNPNSLDQTNEKFSYNIVNPYNVKKEDFNTQISTLNGKNFPIYNSFSGNSIVNLRRPIIAPGVSGFSKLNIHFIDKNGKEIGSQLIDPNFLSNQVENDWAAYAYRVNVPKGYKFVDPRENYVAYTSQGSTKQNNLEWDFNYPVELAANSTTNNHSDLTSNNETNKSNLINNSPKNGINTNSPKEASGSSSMTDENGNLDSQTPNDLQNSVNSNTNVSTSINKNTHQATSTTPGANGSTSANKDTHQTTSATPGANGSDKMNGENTQSSNQTANESTSVNKDTHQTTNATPGANGSNKMNGENTQSSNQTVNESTSVNKDTHQTTNATPGANGSNKMNTGDTSAQDSTIAPESQNKPANSSNPSANTSANSKNDSSAMVGGINATPGKTVSDVSNGSSNKGDQNQAQSKNGSKTTVSDNGNVKTESSSNSGTADSITALEKKTGLSADEIKKMLAIAEANDGRAQFQNEQQHVYHVGSQGQTVAEPAGSAVSAPVETASAPTQSTSVASVSVGSIGSSITAPASASTTQAKSSVSSINTSNTLPETGMANEDIEFAAAMLALAGIVMVNLEHEK